MKKALTEFSSISLARLGMIALSALACPALIDSAYAQGAPQCQSVFQIETLKEISPKDALKLVGTKDLKEELTTNYRLRNETLTKRYPQLEFVFKDPEAFVQTMKSRFEQQKKITPEDPRLFNFPEAAQTMKEIRTDLETFRSDLIKELQLEKATLTNRISHSLFGKRSNKVETISKSLQYIKQLQSDIDKMVASDNYPYRDTIYTLYYYSRIRGIFQFKELSSYYQVAKHIDMWMHGYRRLNIDSELTLYKTKGSPIVQVRSGKISHEFRAAELPFRDAFERTDTLEYVIIPSVYALGSSAFMHVLPHKIHFIGATNTPIQADGFNRPGGLFWMHDVRHEADRYMKVNAYKKAHNLTASQEQTLSLMMHKWHAEFLNLKNSFTDADVKGALDHYHFYTHHDVGVPLIPSMFLNHHKDGMAVYYAFLWHKKNAGQAIGYKDWVKNTRKAQDILTQFWTERLALEKQLLQKDPVHLKNWEEWFPQSHQGTRSQTAVFNKAIESNSLVRVMTETSGIDGTLSKVVYGNQGEPIFLQFAGKAQLVDQTGKVLPGQGASVHGQGYSTPIGKIQKILIDGNEATLSQLRPQQALELQYESGVVVKGELKSWSIDEMGQLNILTFKTAEVKVSDKVLYKPEWGSFDLLMGKTVTSIEFLN